MGLKLKNVNIMGVHQFLGEGASQKNNMYEEFPEKGGLAKNRKGVFTEGVDTSMHTMT